MVGDEGLGLAAAAEAGVSLERLLMVTAPEPRAALEATAALVGSVDVVLVGAGVRFGAADRRRLAARLRDRGSVLIQHGGGAIDGAEIRLQVVASRWSGLGDGWGLLRSRRVSVQVTGRGAAGRPRTVDLLLPGPQGTPVAAGARRGSPAGLLGARLQQDSRGMTAPVRTLVARGAGASGDFEAAVAALGDVTPQLEVSEPGICAFASRGPSRYFGGDVVLAGLVIERMSQALESPSRGAGGHRRWPLLRHAGGGTGGSRAHRHPR